MASSDSVPEEKPPQSVGTEEEELIHMIQLAVSDKTPTLVDTETQAMSAMSFDDDSNPLSTAAMAASNTTTDLATPEEILSDSNSDIDKDLEYSGKMKNFLDFVYKSLPTVMNLDRVTQYCIGDNWLELFKFEYKTKLTKKPVMTPVMDSNDWEKFDLLCTRMSRGSGKTKEEVRQRIQKFVKDGVGPKRNTEDKLLPVADAPEMESVGTNKEPKDSDQLANLPEKVEKSAAEKKAGFPTDNELRETIVNVVLASDMDQESLMDIIDKVFKEYPDYDLERKRDFIVEVTMEII